MWKTPRFWYQKNHSPLSQVLRPMSWVYYSGYLCKKILSHPQRLSCPIICVGNIVAGGAGKTPTTIALSEILKSLGLSPHLLTRGYGGKEAGPHLVAPGDSASLIGDEALLLARSSPTWVSETKIHGARAAAHAGADVIIMDDGLQNFSLKKTLSFLVVDGERGFGNKSLLPAGPLRESLKSLLPRIQGIIFVGKDNDDLKMELCDVPIFLARILPYGPIWKSLKRKRLIAFAGIAHPVKFFDTLRYEGLALIGQRSFPDHFPYTENDLRPLIQRAAEAKATLVTTEKDFTRVPLKYRSYVTSMPIRLVFDETEKVADFIKCCLSADIPGITEICGLKIDKSA